MFFRQWDEDKYLSLGKMLLDNYKQALRIIKVEGLELAEAQRSLSITDDDLDGWFKEQSNYIATVGQECPWDIHAVAYVELLQKLRVVS